MERRNFMKATAASAVLASAPLAAARRGRERLRVGLIGTGLRGQSHLDLRRGISRALRPNGPAPVPSPPDGRTRRRLPTSG